MSRIIYKIEKIKGFVKCKTCENIFSPSISLEGFEYIFDDDSKEEFVFNILCPCGCGTKNKISLRKTDEEAVLTKKFKLEILKEEKC